MNSLYGLIENCVRKYENRPAVLFHDHEITYKQLKEACDRLAGGLQKLGIGKGDRIALMLPNVPHFIISYFALLKLGVTIVPISVYDKANEIHHQLEDSEAKGIIYGDKYRMTVQTAVQGLAHCNKLMVLGQHAAAGELRLPHLMEINEPLQVTEDVSEDDTAVVVYTAGITGRPKGAELTHKNILSNIEACVDFLKLKPDDRVASTVPLFFPIGQTLAAGSFMAAGGAMVLLTQSDSETIVSVIQKFRPTYFVSYPSVLQSLLMDTEGQEPDLASLSFWLTSGDALKPEILEIFESRYHVPVLEGYGLTEASPMVSFNNPAGERRPGSIGLPLPGVEIKVVDVQGQEIMSGQVGEIIVQGPNVMKGYLNRPEATKEAVRDGWLYTGDLARIDESGYASIVARKKNVIMKSGFSVYPTEVEKCLIGHPKVKEAVVVGLPDNLTGEEIHACVVLKRESSASPAEIIEYAKEHMAAYKCPRTVFFVLSLPKGPGQRVLRDQVKQILQEKLN
ncbi:AMP-binding protein [bacterium]|nr:AMP-binding protein [bacterium]